MSFEPTTPTLAQLQQAAQLIDMKVSEMPDHGNGHVYEVQRPAPNGTVFSYYDTRAKVAAALQQDANELALNAMRHLGRIVGIDEVTA